MKAMGKIKLGSKKKILILEIGEKQNEKMLRIDDDFQLDEK